jgi:hypothetical protein
MLTEQIKVMFHWSQLLFQMNPSFFRRLPYLRGYFDDFARQTRRQLDFFEKQIQAHLTDFDADDLESPATDLVEAFLKEKTRRDANGEQGHSFTLV